MRLMGPRDMGAGELLPLVTSEGVRSGQKRFSAQCKFALLTGPAVLAPLNE